MKRHWHIVLLLVLLSWSLQSCLGIGDDGAFKTTTTNQNGQVGINTTDQAKFSGKIYFVLNHTLYVLDGADSTHTPRSLTHGLEVHDPAVSPDGKQIAFVARYPNYSDLMLMSADGSNVRTLRSGKGVYVDNPPYAPKATFIWYAQPAWSADGKRLLFLSDLGKSYLDPGVNAFFLDLQMYVVTLDNPGVTQPQRVACAAYGGGGLRNPAYRPGHPDQIVYTSYYYDAQNQIDLYSRLYLVDANAVANSPCHYLVGVGALTTDPAVPITPQGATIANREPAFSPDGNSILYTRREDVTHTSIYVMPVADNVTNVPMTPTVAQKAMSPYNQSVRLLTEQYLSFPAWSPAGKQIVYMGYENNTFDLWLATLVQDPKSGAYSIKADSQVQLTNANGALDSTSRPCWVA
jgi:Tol biopolymer transport system component